MPNEATAELRPIPALRWFWELPDGEALLQGPDGLSDATLAVDLYREPEREAAWLEFLDRADALRYLLIRGQCRQRLLDQVATRTRLTHLDIDDGRGLDLAPLRALTGLTYASVRGTFTGHETLFRLTSLRQLALHSSRTPFDFTRLAATDLPDLEGLALFSSGTDTMTLLGVEHIARLPRLTELWLWRPTRASDRDLTPLVDAPALRYLTIAADGSWKGLDALRAAGVEIVVPP